MHGQIKIKFTGSIFQSLNIFFEARHQRCVSNKSNYEVYAYIVKHNYRLGGILFTICKAQLHFSATNVGHLQVVQRKLINQLYMRL